MKGWFDAFRDDGGPTLYAYSNRTSVTGDVPLIIISLVFATIYTAFVILFPGIRKERFSTFCTITLSLLTGITLCICSFGSNWEVGNQEIISSYRAFSHHKIRANLGVSIGLDHANITLKVIPMDNKTLDINYNERFMWVQPRDLKEHYVAALKKGLPYPVLTAAEYLTVDKEGFFWGRHYRNAGYYTGILLWSAFATWVLTNILILNVPRYGAYMMIVTGSLMGCAALTFWTLKPPTPLKMHFEDAILTFSLGWCFWMVVIVGVIVFISGLIISTVDWIYPHRFSTFIEVDFDTPYDRHIIIEESVETRKRFKIPKLEEPLNAGVLNVGASLLRRLSKRRDTRKDRVGELVETDPGVDNPAFEMSIPAEAKEPRIPWKSSLMMRSDSKRSNKSIKSVNFRGSTRSQAFLDIPDLPKDDNNLPIQIPAKVFVRSESKLSQFSFSGKNIEPPVSSFPDFNGDIVPTSPGPLPIMSRQDSVLSSSSSSSFGLSLLARDPSVKRLMDEHNGHAQVTRNNSGNIIVFHRTDSRGQLQRLNGEVVEIQTDDIDDTW